MAPGRWRLTLAMALVALFVLAWWGTRAPGSGRERPPGRPGGVWVEALPAMPASLDPARAEGEAEVRLAALLYDGLVRLGPDGRLYPALARRWEVRDGGTRYVFWLRPGVRFHNGRPLTAADVVFSLTRLVDPRRPSPRAWVLEGVEGAGEYRLGRAPAVRGVRALGSDRVEIRLVEPRPAFLYRLATPGGAVVDAETVRASAGGAFPAVGTGPFRLVARTEREVRLEAFPGYYRGRPYLDAVQLLAAGPRNQTLAAFAAGQLTAVRLLPHEVRDLAARGWTGPQWPMELPATAWIEINAARAPLTHPAARRALAYAVDRETLVAGLAPGGYRLAEGWIPPGLPGAAGEPLLPPYRVLEARSLLQTAGVRPGTALRWLQPGDPFWAAVAGRLDYLVGRLGIELEVATVGRVDFPPPGGGRAPYHLAPRATWAEYPDPEAVFLPWLNPPVPAPDTPGAPDPAGVPGDAAIRQALGRFLAAQGQTRGEAAAALERRLLEAGAGLPLYHPRVVWAVQPGVRGFVPSPFPQGADLWAVSLAAAARAGR
ncbi:extracellular solute-binding protein family 5 [Thermaerobacter marianensis DSM 12885]|uniref:Extracellular solute-binding protein family 5 n=1 Tax=Thermaerobacter marianensis (strain ATCC 700841 / DSM 12885 / JCM 10246 / 7p75a) TaxID=644966 RepID=E6SJL8_THEM7|nr:ABC transporter substrate-binding protein [Thermaerobacter marianensis]ADU51081.1 extracellular solute-binding protein family 5 [Thermaerobacter marianensis DSM 12885]